MNPKPKYSHLEIHQFKKGQSGNLSGRPKAYQTILKELGYTKPMIASMTAEIMFMPYNEAKEIDNNDKEPLIRKVIATAFRKASYNGEYRYIEPFLKLLFDKPIPYIPESPQEDKENSNV